MLLASNKQASNSRRREMRVVAFLSQNDSGSCLWGPVGACHPHLGLHCYEAIRLFTYTVARLLAFAPGKEQAAGVWEP